MKEQLAEAIRSGEEGHATTVAAGLIPLAGSVLLGIGAANDTGWMAIVGGIVLGVGIIAVDGIRHATIDKGMYGRLDRLDGNKPLDK